MTSSMLDILEKLIAAKSISPTDDGLISYIASILSENKFTCYIKEFGEGGEKTINLYAEFGSSGKNLCFAGHVDVVPPGDENSWNGNPFLMTCKDGKIYGRGAVDMKGAVACMISALTESAKQSDARISILLTSDEEASGKYGTKKMLEWMEQNNKQIDFTIIGEPTSSEKMGDIIKIGRRGSINFELTILGKQGHVAYPELALNPNRLIVFVLNELMSNKIDDGNEYFQSSNLKIVSIDVGNKTMNLIPEKATAKFNIRFSNVKTAEQIIFEIRKIISNVTNNFELVAEVCAEAFLTGIDQFTREFQKISSKICGVESKFSTSGGTSDARFIKNYCPLLEFGLLNATAHHVNEYTEIRDLQKLYNVYYHAIKSYHESS